MSHKTTFSAHRLRTLTLSLVAAGLVACGGGGGSSSTSTAPSVTYAVTNLNDSGAGSFRAALEAANANPSQYSAITFQVAGTITLASNLPAITSRVLIDGTTAPGYTTTNGPTVALNFNNAYNGLNFNTGSSLSGMSGLAIVRSNSNGITLNAGSIALMLNQVGIDLSGADAGNAEDGIHINATSNNNRIGDNLSSASNYFSNLISGNGGDGIEINGSSGNTVQSNLIGINRAGTAAIKNDGNGILITAAASNNTIGGTAYYDSSTQQTNNPTGNKGTVPIVAIRPPQGNVVSGNDLNGILIERASENNVLSGNFVGTSASGNSAVANRLDGVLIRLANNNSLIGCTFVDEPFIYYNVLSGNGANGLHISDSNNITVQANFFGAGGNNQTMVGNGMHGIWVSGSSTAVQVGGVIPLGNVSAGNALDGINVSGTVSGFTTFNTFGGLFAFQGAAPNRRNGITITATGGNNLIRTNVFSGNYGNGIELSGDAYGVTVDPNIVGLDSYGTGWLANSPTGNNYGNGGSGVLVKDNASFNYIGGYNQSVIPQNTLSGNSRYGVEIVGNAHHNYLFNSAIGISSDQVSVFGNAMGGVYIGGNSRNTYAGIFTPPNSTTTGKASNISGNVGFGVTVADTASYTTVQSNCIGCNILGVQDPAFRNTLGTTRVTSTGAGNDVQQ